MIWCPIQGAFTPHTQRFHDTYCHEFLLTKHVTVSVWVLHVLVFITPHAFVAVIVSLSPVIVSLPDCVHLFVTRHLLVCLIALNPCPCVPVYQSVFFFFWVLHIFLDPVSYFLWLMTNHDTSCLTQICFGLSSPFAYYDFVSVIILLSFGSIYTVRKRICFYFRGI